MSFDCVDGSDELCRAGCAPEAFQGEAIMRRCEEMFSICLPVQWYCDGNVQCPYGSDERSCSCQDWNLEECISLTRIKSALCIPKEWQILNYCACTSSFELVNIDYEKDNTVLEMKCE